jgi:hypothetical protein
MGWASGAFQLDVNVVVAQAVRLAAARRIKDRRRVFRIV